MAWMSMFMASSKALYRLGPGFRAENSGRFRVYGFLVG